MVQGGSQISAPILVVGSINMDFVVRTPRAPLGGESILAYGYSTFQGGKGANQAIALSRLGAHCKFLGKVGDDQNGVLLRQSLIAEGVGDELVLIDSQHNTGLAVIILEDNGQNRILVVNGANDQLQIRDIEQHLNQEQQYSGILLQLEIPLETVEFIIKQGKRLGIPVFVDAGPSVKCDLKIFTGVEVLSPNQIEAHTLTGVPTDTLEGARRACEVLLAETNARLVVLKMGDAGSMVLTKESCQVFPALDVDAKDTTAAGDGFTAALTYRLIEGDSIEQAVMYASAVGALTVTKLGASQSLPTATEVSEFLKVHGL